MQQHEFGCAEAGTEARYDIVNVDSLRLFPELVLALGGDSAAFLRRDRINPAVLRRPGGVIEYRSLVQLLEHAATELSCPDFGLRLASMQGGYKPIGPLGVAMRHSRTIGQAMGYAVKHVHAYCAATRVCFEPDRIHSGLLYRLEILLPRIADARQAAEYALMLANLNIIELTGGAARARKVLFTHAPIADPACYREHFGCDVQFNQHANGLVVSEEDLLCEIVDADPRVYEMATSFINTFYPRSEAPLHARVRYLVARNLGSEDSSVEAIAAELCLHPRTLQRRLRAVGCSFEDIKDEARRDAAMHYIEQDLPLAHIAEKLGYAETSVLVRSCLRWFSASPREIRLRTKLDAAERVGA